MTETETDREKDSDRQTDRYTIKVRGWRRKGAGCRVL